MSVVEPPSSQPGDELEELLRTFLQGQLPQPWPSPPQFLSTIPPSLRWPLSGRALRRSRWALAASAALLLFGSWLLPSRFTPDAPSGHRPNGPMISNIPLDAPKEHKRPRQGPNKNKPRLAGEEKEHSPEGNPSEIPMLK